MAHRYGGGTRGQLDKCDGARYEPHPGDTKSQHPPYIEAKMPWVTLYVHSSAGYPSSNQLGEPEPREKATPDGVVSAQ